MTKRHLTPSLLVIVIILFLCVSIFFHYAKKWKYLNRTSRQRLVILDYAKLNRPNKKDFIFLLETTNKNNPVFHNAEPDGDDILFVLAEGKTRLEHKIKEFVSSDNNYKLSVHLKLPDLSSNDVQIYMYYGNVINFKIITSAFDSNIHSQDIPAINYFDSAVNQGCPENSIIFETEETMASRFVAKFNSLFRIKIKFPEAVTLVKEKVFVSDTNNDRIQVFDANGNFVMEWGTRGSLNGQLKSPRAIAVYKNEIYAVDRANERIQVFDLSGNYKRKWGAFGDKDGQFGGPRGIAVVNNEVYVVDTFNSRIQVFDLRGIFQRKWGRKGSGPGEFQVPIGIAAYKNEIYVVDAYNYRVQVFGSDGSFRRQWGQYGCRNGELNSPIRLAVYNDEVYVGDKYNHRIQVFDLAGNFKRKFGGLGTADGYLYEPYGIAVYNNEIYVADRRNNRIQVFDLQGSFLRKWGTLGICYDGDQKLPCGTGEFYIPFGVTVTPVGSDE